MNLVFRLKHYLRPHLWLFVGSCLLAIPLSALRVGPAVLVQRVVDELMVQKDASKLLLFPTLFIGLYLVNFLVRFAHYYMMRIVVTRIDQKLKNDLFEHLLGLSSDFFTERSTGTLISRVGVDPNYVINGVASISSLIREPVTFLLFFGYALYLSWQLTLITFIIFPPLTWVFARTGKNLKRYIHGISDENAKLISTLQESFTGIRIIKAFRLEKYVRDKYRERTDRYAQILLKSAALEEASHPMVELLTALVIAIAVYYGGRLIINGKMTQGELSAFFLAFGLMMNPIRALNEVNIKLNQASAAYDRINEVLQWRSRITEAASPRALPEFRNSIELKDVTFSYPEAPSRNVLTRVSFSLPKGKVLALAGASGSGKSSLVNLIIRMYDPTAGRIEIDGHDLREYSVEDLRRQIAIVSQDVFLFNDTIEENIRCGRLSATKEEIREAARHAHALEFIEKMPHGFGTVIGDRGLKLSGGERQRLSIARAFLRESPILILDEATSSLDSKSEKAVQEALEELMVGKTTLVIAHRLSTIRNADRILVLKDGEVIEEGNHDELLEKGGEYARFHGTYSL